MNRRRTGLAFLTAMLLPAALYLPTLDYGFLFDDRPLLIENPLVQSPRGLGEILTTDLDPSARTADSPATNYLRPLFVAAAAGLHRLFGAEPRGWHATAILLHGLLAGLAFLLLRRESVKIGMALAAALLFALHPAHVQATAWVSGLQDLLFGVTALGAFLAYGQSRRRDSPGWIPLFALAVAFALALLAKEPAVGLVIFVAAEAAGWIPAAPGDSTARRPRVELAVLLGVALGYFVYRWSVLGGLAHAFPTAPSWPRALASVPAAILAYLRDLVWPVDLFLLHAARPVPAVASRETAVAVLGLALVLMGIGWARRRRPDLARPFGWMGAWLAPVLALWAVNPEWMVMDRYLLLPSLGLAWIVALLLPVDSIPPLRPASIIWLALLLSFAALSLLAMRPFADEERFWSAAIRADPGSSTAWTEWARQQSEKGDFLGAEKSLRRAVELDPRAQLPRLRQALAALGRGDAAAAVGGLTDLMARNPNYLPAWRNLVVAQARNGDRPGAVRTLAQALNRFPEDPLLWTQQAILLRQEGRREEALSAVQRAAALAPRDAALALREASLLSELGRSAEAADAARRGLLSSAAPEIRAALEALAH